MSEHTEKELSDICKNIYLAVHVSELKSLPRPVIEAWYAGLDIYSERLKREHIKHG